MEKENREVIENAEQKEDDSVKSNGKDSKKERKWFSRIKAYIKKHPYRILAVILLCIALFFVLRETGVISKHVYEEVENLGEREGVCFDNLLLSSVISLYNNTSGEYEHKYLCIFNTGDIYCFEWSESIPWDWYYWGDEVGHERGYDDTSWNNAERVIYLGRLSNRQTDCLNKYVQNYDIEGEYYNIRSILEVNSKNNVQNLGEEIIYVWRYHVVRMYWHGQPEKNSSKDEVIESYEMNYIGNCIYEKGELRMKSYDENAIAALELFESSLFYYRWVYMCLHNG